MHINASPPSPRLYWVVVGLVLLNLFLVILPPEITLAMIREGGLVEVLSAVGYFSAIIFLLVPAYRKKVNVGCSTGFILLLFGMRELDFHRRFTTMGIFKTKFFVSSVVPLAEKIVISLILVCLLIFVILYLRKNSVLFFKRLREKVEYAILIAAGIGLMVFSKFMDSYSEPLKRIFILFYDDPDFLARIIEETCEMAIPVIFILAIIHYRYSENVHQTEGA